MDPVLKVFYWCPVILTNNFEVESGLANGTEAKVLRVVLKTGESPFKVKMELDNFDEIIVRFIELENLNKSINPRIFQLQPKDFSFDASFPSPVSMNAKEKQIQCKMTAHHLLIISNSATTDHKMQGATCEKLFINAFSYRQIGRMLHYPE